MPPNSVSVARPGPWGNSYVVREADGDATYGIVIPAITAEQAVAMHRERLIERLWQNPDLLEPLRGVNVCCWCKVGALWCHGDTYLEFANLTRSDMMKRMAACRRVA